MYVYLCVLCRYNYLHIAGKQVSRNYWSQSRVYLTLFFTTCLIIWSKIDHVLKIDVILRGFTPLTNEVYVLWIHLGMRSVCLYIYPLTSSVEWFGQQGKYWIRVILQNCSKKHCVKPNRNIRNSQIFWKYNLLYHIYHIYQTMCMLQILMG